MRLKVVIPTKNTHTGLVSSVAWFGNELFSCSDDGTIWRWDKSGEAAGGSPLLSTDTGFTDICWAPAPNRKATGSGDMGPDLMFAVGCTDGSVRLVTKQGRLEKHIKDAHVGAVTAIRWSFDGSLLTAGEDGKVKVWSRKGLPRTTLLQLAKSIYSMVWSPNNEQILVTCGNELIIKPLQATNKQMQWTAHDSNILKVDWNAVNNLIVSGGEDCRYKVWDSFGRLLFCSQHCEYPITSVSWCPNGDFFAIGSFNNLKLCDKTGWSYSKERTPTGSVFDIAWTTDGTQLAASCGNGAVFFGTLVDRTVEWSTYSVVLDENQSVLVSDVNRGLVEDLGTRERVVKMAMGHNHFIVCTTAQCSIFNTSKWSNPVPIDLKDNVSLIALAEKCFVLVDSTSGVQVFNYEGRLLCTPKFQGLRPEFLNSQTVSLSSNHIAIVDRASPFSIHVFDLTTGRPTGVQLQHKTEISEVLLSQKKEGSEHCIAIIDKNGDMFISPIASQLSSMVDSARWNENSNMIAAISDGKFLIWYHPYSVLVDPDLLKKMCYTREASEVGLHSHLVGFDRSKCTVRKADGALISLLVTPYAEMLHGYIEKREWAFALKLCRYVKETALWAMLASMAINLRELDTAEICLAAIEEVDKLRFIKYINSMKTSPEVRTSMLLLYRRQVSDAERVLLQSSAIYRAIKMNIQLYRWERALEIAHNIHVDTVLAYRKRYLEQWKRTETSKKFLAQANVPFDWEKVKEKIRREKEDEQHKQQR